MGFKTTAALGLIAGLGVSAGGRAEPNFGAGIYCQFDEIFATLMLAMADESGGRQLRIDDQSPSARTRAPVRHSVQCRVEVQRFICQWGVDGALYLSRSDVGTINGSPDYVLVPGTVRNSPGRATQAVRCFVKRARDGD